MQDVVLPPVGAVWPVGSCSRLLTPTTAAVIDMQIASVSLLNYPSRLMMTHGELAFDWSLSLIESLRDPRAVWDLSSWLGVTGTFSELKWLPYADGPIVVPKPGKRDELRPRFNIVSNLEAAIEDMKRAQREVGDQTKLRFIQSVYSPSVLMFTPALLVWHKTFEQALREEIISAMAIAELNDIELILQFEEPVAHSCIHLTPERMRPHIATRFMTWLAGFIKTLPNGTKFVIHFCNGNLHDKTLVDTPDMSAFKLAYNTFVYVFNGPQSFLGAHVPGPFNKQGVILDPEAYADLEDLHYVPGTAISIGIVDKLVSWDDASLAYRLVFDALGVPHRVPRECIAISCRCGEGRQKFAEDALNMHNMRTDLAAHLLLNAT